MLTATPIQAATSPARHRPGATAAHGPRRAPIWDRGSFATLLALTVWAPLPLGSNRDWAVGLLAAALWATLALRCLAARPWLRGRPAWSALQCARWPLAALSAFCLLVLAQRASVLPGVLHTPDVHLTAGYLLRALAYLAAFALVMLCVNTPQRVAGLLGAVVAGGVLQAVLAVVLHSSRARYQYLFTEFVQGHRAMGTFPNPDHLAGYMELTLSAGLGLLLAQFAAGHVAAAPAWQQRAATALRFLMSAKMRLRLMLVVMVVALVMTHSRMGNGAFFLSLLLMGGLVAALSAQWRRPALWLVLSMALVDVVIVGQWVGLGRVIERLQDTAESTSLDAQPAQQAAAMPAMPATGGLVAPAKAEESIQDRLRIPRLSLPLVVQQPWFGHGGGTYVLALPPIKPAGFPHHWDHAHNDYVEIAVDTGLVGLALLLGMASASAWRAARLIDDRHPPLDKGVGVATLTALCCMALHSMVDFNLQIPANALTLVLLCALPWATAAQRRMQAARPTSFAS